MCNTKSTTTGREFISVSSKARTPNSVHHFRLQVYLDDLVSDAVRIELFADQADGLPAECYPMTRGERLVGAKGWLFAAHVESARPAEHFTPRAYAYHPELAVPLECPAIKWQR